jgi:hypothetical protein
VRSVFVHLRDATEHEVAVFLQRTYPFQNGPPWICDAAGDPCLYIDFYRDRMIEFEREDLVALASALGREPATSVIADVSGRHSGDEQVRSFVTTMLRQFAGLAQDDYTEHYWTATEVLSGFQMKGHRFFDRPLSSA